MVSIEEGQMVYILDVTDANRKPHDNHYPVGKFGIAYVYSASCFEWTVEFMNKQYSKRYIKGDWDFLKINSYQYLD